MRPRDVPDRPFPGARSQVPHATGELAAPPPSRMLPLCASVAAAGRGWVVRLAVRAEQLAIEKEVVVYERVVVGTREVDDVARAAASARREQLRVKATGTQHASDVTVCEDQKNLSS